MQRQPPKWAMKFLEKTCSSTFLDELQGDLLELFYRDLECLGIKKAKRRFIWKVLLSPRWHRFPVFTQIYPTIMYRNHLKMAFRHALRDKSSSVIQALGLMLGLAAIFFIGLYLKNEFSYDKMHENSANLYRVLRFDPLSGERGQATSSLHGATLKEEFPFLSVCRFGNDPVKIGEVKPKLVEDFFWADSTFFELFSFSFLYGNPATCLDEVNSLVITESLSKQLFGTADALGRSIPVKVYDGDQEFLMKVTGIVEDLPQKSHIQFEALGAMANAEMLYASLLNQWGFSWLRTYIQVPDQRLAEVEAGIPRLLKNHFGENPPPEANLYFQAFGDVYLKSQDIPKNTFRGNIRNLGIFGAIGIVILLISLMNYVNLATAKAVGRTKEVGIRKTLGSNRMGIIGQFLMESVLFTLFGGLAALFLVVVSLPALNALLDLELSFAVLSWNDWLISILLIILVGVIVGVLPSLAMARLPMLSDPYSAISFKVSKWSVTRKFFVGVQYLVTLVLLVSTFVIYEQYQFLKDFDLGFDSNQVLHIAVDDRQIQEKLGILKEQVLQLPGVVKATATGEDLPSELNNTWGLDWNGSDSEEPMNIDIIGVDQDYFDLLGIAFKAGRNFNHQYAVDSARSVILNEQALKMMNRVDVVDQQLEIGGRNRTVIGVVENHHNTTLHSKIVPLAYFIFPPGARVSPDNLLVKVQTDDLPALMTSLESIWGEFSRDPLSYNFVDEAFATAYQAERRFSALVGFFTIIAVIISLVGLFGLVSYMVEHKLKEISIRRVLGATQLNLMRLVGQDFFIVFMIALVLAIPTAIYFINAWLSNYAYRIDWNAFLLVPAILLCLSISVLVIYYHLQRATSLNPSELLAAD